MANPNTNTNINLTPEQRMRFMAMRGIPQARLVNLVVPTGYAAPVLSFPEQPDLRYARILGIEVLSAGALANSIPDQTVVIPDANLINVALTLETNDADDWSQHTGSNGRFGTTGQHIKYLPIALLNRTQTATPAPFVRQLFEFNNIYVTWEKSFVSFGTALGNGVPWAIPFMVYYTWRDIMGNLIAKT